MSARRFAWVLCLGVVLGLGLSAGAGDKATGVSEEAFSDLMANEVLDLQDLADGAEIQRRMFNRMTPAGFSWLQPMFPSVAPFDSKYFDEAFLDGLLGEDTNSVAVYPLSLVLDPKTRETLIYNAGGGLIATVPADEVNPIWPEDADPSRVTLQLNLLPVEDAEQYLYAKDRVAESLASVASKSAKSPRTGGITLKSLGVGQFGFADAEPLTNGNFRLTVTNGMDVAEVYSYTVWHTSSVVVVTWTNEESNMVTDTNTLWTPISPSYNGLESEWDFGTTNLVLTNGVGVWEDSNVSSNARVRFYAAAQRMDSDGDGLSDGMEIFLYRTDPGLPDSDGDGVGDGVEVGQGGDPLDPAEYPVDPDLEAALAGINLAQIGYLSYLCDQSFAYDPSTNYAQRIQTLREALAGLAGSFLDLDVNVDGVLAERPNVVVWTLDTVLSSTGNETGDWLEGLATTSQVEEIAAVLGQLTHLVHEGSTQTGYPHTGVVTQAAPFMVGSPWDLGNGYPEDWPTNQTIKTYLLLDTKIDIPNVGPGTVDDWIEVNGTARFPSYGEIYLNHVADISAPTWDPSGTNRLELWDCGDCAGPNDYAYLSPFKVVQVLEAPGIIVDLDVDTDRDGAVHDDNDEPGEEEWTLARGALVPPRRWALSGTNSLEGMAELVIQPPNTALDAQDNMSMRLKKYDGVDDNYLWMVDENGIEIRFDASNTYVLPFWPSNGVAFYAASWESRNYTNGEPVRFTIALELMCSNEVVYSDSVRLTVAPLILPPECHTAETVYSTTNLSIPGITLLDADAWPWTQDIVKFTQTQLSSNASQIAFVSLGSGELYDVLQNEEGLQGLGWDVNDNGGNIMATPPLGPLAPYGKILVGTKHPASVPQWVNQGLQPVVTNIDTTWLYVGHVDEIFMWISTNKVLYADPWVATDILHTEIAAGRESGQLWFGLDASGTNATIAQAVIATNQAGYKLTSLPSPGLSASTNNATLVFSESMFSAGDILRVGSEILSVISANGPSVTVARAQAESPPASHSPGSIIYAYSAVLQANLPVGLQGESVVEYIATASNQLRQALGAYPATFEPMPVLFGEMSNSGTYIAYSANVVNCLIGVGGAIHYSYTGCSAFESHIQSIMPGAQPHDVWEKLHCREGEIHCATAAIRSIQPHYPWWNLVNSWE